MRPALYKMPKTKILITGGAGFIGSAFVRLMARHRHKVTVIDKLTYAGDLRRLAEAGKYLIFNKADICNQKQIESVFKKARAEAVINFSAETHVDRSILDAASFIDTNIRGTQILLDTSRKYKIKKFVHISTDEVYGEIPKGAFVEGSPLAPSSPYAASKAAADLLIKAYVRTHKFPAIIIRPCNNYGPWQYPEKLIPLAVLKILRKEKIPLYADGKNVREWLYVDDCAEGISRILAKGRIGECYNLGSNTERQNIEVISTILHILNLKESSIQFIKDRPGHDKRYKLNSQKLFRETGWRPKIRFEEGIKLTISWYFRNKNWLLSKYRNIEKLYA